MQKHFLTLSDLTAAEIRALLSRALRLKHGRKKFSQKLMGRVLALIFEKESTRTRISFEVAMAKLGGRSIYLGRDASQLSRGETYADTARVLSRYVDALVLRTFSHAHLIELASHSSVPVINGLTDSFHPCQVLADLMTILEKKRCLTDLNIVYLGDGNNMANTWIEAAGLLNLKLVLACPHGYIPTIKLSKQAKLTHDPKEAAQGADVINTDTWFSMGQKISDAKKKAFKKFQVNVALLKRASRNCMVLHCLPAHRGEEITSEVMDGPHSAIFDQAENRLYVQMALLERLL